MSTKVGKKTLKLAQLAARLAQQPNMVAGYLTESSASSAPLQLTACEKEDDIAMEGDSRVMDRAIADEENMASMAPTSTDCALQVVERAPGLMMPVQPSWRGVMNHDALSTSSSGLIGQPMPLSPSGLGIATTAFSQLESPAMTSAMSSSSTPICLHLPAWEWVLSTDLSAFGLGLSSTPTLPLHLVNAPEFGGLPAYPYADPTALAEFEAKLAAMWEIQKGFAEHITKCIDGMGENFGKGFNVQAENLATVYNQAAENAKSINALAEHLRSLGPT